MKKQRLMIMEPQVPYLPEETIKEIISRLPVKTLMKFKSVCRSWCTLISDPQFLMLHLERSIDQNRLWLMFLKEYGEWPLAYEAPLGASNTNNRPIQVGEYTKDGVEVVACCNGLFCITNVEDDFFLWNPSTTETQKIPYSMIQFPDGGSRSWASVFFGLGYHSASDDYKLVRVSIFDITDFRTEVKIYSRNTNAWKRIGDFPYDCPYGAPGVFVSGCLHWVLSTWDNGVHSFKVSALDIAEENYGLIQLPEKATSSYFNIVALAENLVLFSESYVNRTCNIWILNEYGNAESWTWIKIATDSIASDEPFIQFRPFCLLKPAGEIIFRIGLQKVVSYSLKEKQFSITLVPQIVESRVACFVESLVSPNKPKSLIHNVVTHRQCN